MHVTIGRYGKDGDPEGWERKVKVKINQFDTWNMDSTLALIIHPMLIQLRDTSHGYPGEFANVDEGGKGGGYDAWLIVLNHMIWAFNEIIQDDYTSKFYNERTGPDDKDWIAKTMEHERRIQEGINLFAQFYRSLWD